MHSPMDAYKPADNPIYQQLLAGQLHGIERLDLSCGLTEFPREIFDLADSLQVLNLSGNALTQLPDDLHRLHRLRVLFCSNNPFTELPAVLGQCTSLQMVGFKSNQIRHVPASALPLGLRWLILTDNHITSLPAAIGQCGQLQKLMLAGNRLEQLPPELARCQQLELLRISANQLNALPGWLLQLPRLAWLAYAGNPLDADRAAAPAPPIPWQQLRLQHILGEGASGVIHQAELQDPDAPRTVAVKLFKGAVTSDGWPHSEMAACLATGAHPHIIPVTGPLTGHPDGTAGLVLEYIPPHYTTLAGPPSLHSCTRDVYPAGTQFTQDKILRIALGVARAAEHLHGQGLLHGDLYAHNLQCDADGNCLLGDMGAAAFLPADAALSQALQRLEVRAFGCLLEELLAHADGPVPAHLISLRDSCLQADVAQRPLFTPIVQCLLSLNTLKEAVDAA